MNEIYSVVLCSRSLQDLLFDTKHGHLSRLTPNEPIWGQGQDEAILKQQQKSHIFSELYLDF